MKNRLNKRYGLFTAICMVAGIVIGSGIFFKAPKVLEKTGGNMPMSLLTVATVGAIMLICSYVFSVLARRVEHVNGIVDYAEASCGGWYSYIIGWFSTYIYFPTMISAIGWISATYTASLCGFGDKENLVVALTVLFLGVSFMINTFAPAISGKFQVSTTVIKLIPIAILVLVGTVIGLINGQTLDSLNSSNISVNSENSGFFGAVVAFAFAYEGWIVATTINSEIKDSKKNLPRALIIGGIIVVVAYIGYYLGLAGILSPKEIMEAGGDLPKVAYTTLFGGNPIFGTIVYVFIIISCLGTMNGCMMGGCRGMYSLAKRGQGPRPEVFSKLDERTNMPIASCVIALVMSLVWLFQWEFGLIEGILPKFLCFEHDELPIITLYGGYIPIFISMMIKAKDLNVVNRFVMPSLAILCSIFMVSAAVISYKIEALYYLIVFAVIIGIGQIFYRKNAKSEITDDEENEADVSAPAEETTPAQTEQI